MRHRWLIVSALFLSAFAAVADVSFPRNARVPDAAPGQTISIPVNGLTAQNTSNVTVTDEMGRSITMQGKVDPDKTDPNKVLVTIALPQNLAPGRYAVTLVTNAAPQPVTVPGELRVNPIKPKIIGIAPEETAYSHSFWTPSFDFRITGDGFVPGITSVITDSGDVLAGPAKCDGKTNAPCVSVENAHIIHVANVSRYRESAGPLDVAVRVGDVRSDESKKLVLSRIPRGAIFVAAFLLWILLAGAVIATVSAIRGKRIGGKRYGIFSVFVIDNQTNTYSLSKLQLLLWSAVSVFAYIYLFLCQLLVQWKWQFPDVPEGLPALLGISGGAAVAAAAVQNTRGAKGSGPIHPGPADFISSGGVVIAERFQFFVWTIVGVLGFLGLLFAADPAAISVLPKIPDQFLGLMGVSALAYLGGKAVRSPGPVVRTVIVTKKDATYEIRIDGENLENDAKFRLDDAADPFTPVKIDAVNQGSNTSPKWSTKLTVSVKDDSDVGKALATGTHRIEVINSDGQSGAGSFTINTPKINPIAPITHKEEEQTLQLAGDNFVSGMNAEWTAPGETEAVKINTVTVTDEKNASVKVTAKTAGKGKLVLVPPIGGLVTADVEVK
jgi:methionine-rich copper-binding protein CopC